MILHEKRLTQVTTVSDHFLCFYEKKLPIISLALNGRRPAMLNICKLCHMTEHMTSFHNGTIHVAAKKHKIITYFGLLSFKVTYLQR